MFCNNCGNQIADNASFCSNCGNAINNQPVAPAEPVAVAPAAEPAYTAAPQTQNVYTNTSEYQEPPVQEPAYTVPQAQNVYNNAPTYQSAPAFNAAPVENVDSGSLLVKGILAIALSELGIPGIILGSMAKKLAAQFMAANGGQIFGKAKVGSILGRVGFGLGIGFTIFWAFYFIIIVGLLGSL